MAKQQTKSRAHQQGATASTIRSDRPPNQWLFYILRRLTWITVGATVVVTPLLVDPKGSDSFRLPKEAFVVTTGIILIAAAVAALIFGAKPPWRKLSGDRTIQLIVAVVVWTGVAVLASTNHALSEHTLTYVVALSAFATAVYWLGRSAPLGVVLLTFIAAVPNCVLYVLQEFQVWNPFATKEQIATAWFARHIFSSAMIGNPDDVGGYFLPIAIASAALVPVSRGRLRLLAIAAAVFFGYATVATLSWAAVGAYVVAIALLLALTLRKPVRATVVAILFGVLVALSYPPLRTRLHTMASSIASRNLDLYALDLALSNRLTPFAAAAAMARDHPLTGVGPGCFGWQYYGYKVMFENAHPELRKSATAYFNFGETHSDHLQTLAVAGLPGYALFVYAIVLLATCSRRRSNENPDRRGEFARFFGLPFAAAFGLHTLMQFPLELASAMSQMVFIAALCLAWRHDETA